MRRTFIAVATATLLLLSLAVAAADSTVRISDHTVDTTVSHESELAPDDTGWWFNRDQTTKTPYEFNFDQASIGYGSLHVLPITNLEDDGVTSEPKDKFIGEYFMFLDDASLLQSISYDFLIAGNGDATDADQFYLNVYANLNGTPIDNWYDCRFDYVPTSGSTSGWTTATFAATDTPVRVADRAAGACPSTLAGMPTGSSVRVFSINVGDTSTSDTGLAGYFDKVVVTVDGVATTFDFEVPLAVKDACKDGGYALYGFDNQGQCVSSLQASSNAGK